MYRKTLPMQPLEARVVKGAKAFRYSHKGVLYKVAFTGKLGLVEQLYEQLVQQPSSQYHIAFEDGVISVTAAAATKLLGILQLCKELGINRQNVMTVGNAENDIEMLSYFSHSVAVHSASDKVKRYSAYTMDVEHLSIFI
jgi:hydroxymethylpyrimidine pyrophosphatase-like HAD family hydrolase